MSDKIETGEEIVIKNPGNKETTTNASICEHSELDSESDPEGVEVAQQIHKQSRGLSHPIFFNFRQSTFVLLFSKYHPELRKRAF